SSLKKRAEIESKKVFTQNLYSLLLSTPVKGKTVLALDPGYTNGCKMALLSPTGTVLETGLMFPTGRKANIKNAQSEVLSLVRRHSCETIAIGNGVACRETEMFIAKMIKEEAFSPLEVVYCIVSEDGASVYSASKEAIAELPDIDLSMRGAVSIGRRLQDPLLELVKIEPKHLGIGMYQHDIPESMLRTALQGVFTDCVSLVGVDVNAAGVSTLKHIAGLNEKKAASILEWRTKNKRFENRKQLAYVKGIGKKSYEQCSGFLKILPDCSRNVDSEVVKSEEYFLMANNDDDDDFDASKRSKRKRPQKKSVSKRSKPSCTSSGYNYLDATLIHPESYEFAEKLMKNLSVSARDIGTTKMIAAIEGLMVKESVYNLASEYGVDVSTVELVIDGLKKPIDYDIRSSFEKPVFKKGLMLFEDLQPGMPLSGRVTNVTTFGAFVDCGVGRDGLIYESQLKNRDDPLSAGDVVEVTVNSVDNNKGQFQLRLVSVRPRLKAQLLTTS
ncbi:S1 RNA-binding domain-containing protein 1, partial [Exaiptasia diaphana]|uniref:S1 motif domain-containing protein n=1 Tax=Exaiptasia diaphana TaxID=2652724 RepID=A0A913WQM4_EXADI